MLWHRSGVTFASSIFSGAQSWFTRTSKRSAAAAFEYPPTLSAKVADTFDASR